ncbi:hypothetical protein SSX86_006928 [Deinandra increscens subsp. villosa]|uniref:TIR domain-containing protein n=1 Tax=Deinandra increscens subsp. villosa TaxID=3103831 RepID=A0AAP0DJP2_9ASTR
MASPSSSSHLITPTSTLQSWTHDVFLSFRGEDTRERFVDHLYTALVQQGIQTYKDDETLARGESIGPSLLKAIRESHIAVVVFSENYADSSWCLDELECIIECMETRGQIVMPVFYEVDPSCVRKQNGKYEEAFVKHESEHKQKVELWRRALVKSGNLSGWVRKDFVNGHEAKFIKEIVGTISSRLSPMIRNVNEGPVGIETRLQDLKSKLKIGSGGVRMVGIWGVGGGGKSTLASAAYMEICNQFEGHCLLENIRDESTKHGLKSLQEKLLSTILNNKLELSSEIEGKSMIKIRLCNKSILVVFDDVDDLEQLEALAGSHDWFGEGSRIIITTRNKHLLSRKTDDVYEVRLLTDDEAIKLFHKHAYRKDKPVEDYERLSLDVVSYAGGLPLALEILGSFLYDKDKDEWMSALAKLERIPHSKVTERLKISYDGLEQDEKGLFLDIACFMRRWEIDDAMRVLDACSFHPGIGVKVLVQKSLIRLSHGCFDMHDLVEEMAHYIVREKNPNHPEKHTRIWQEKDVIDISLMSPKTLMENNHIEVVALESSDPRLPDVIANMKTLRWIYWNKYPASSFPINFQPTKIGCIMLREGRQKQLWKGCKYLPNLKLIDLTRSQSLKKMLDFTGLPCLERLILTGCWSLKKIHPSIGYHERLVYVDMSFCMKLKAFPPIIGMKRLETLDLSSCLSLKKFPDIRTNMDSLVTLRLELTSIDKIPASASVGQFCTNLVYFNVNNCLDLKRIEANFHLLKHLKHLHLNQCSQLERLAHDFFNKECCLEVLSLSFKYVEIIFFRNFTLQHLPQDSWVFRKLPQFPRFLRKLNLSFCNLGDGDIPSDLSDLSNLQELDLSDNNFSRLPSSLSRIPGLKFLNLSRCRSLVELPELPSSIAVLNATYCLSLQRVGNLSKYKCLWEVSFLDCEKLISDKRMLLHVLLEENAVEDHFMSVLLPIDTTFHDSTSTTTFIMDDSTTALITLQLPHNWYSDFSGFLFSLDNHHWRDQYFLIVIKQEMSTNFQPEHHQWKEYDKSDHESYYEHAQVGYVPFASLRHYAEWNSAYSKVSFRIQSHGNFKVLLVPRKSKTVDSSEGAKAITDYSGFGDKENEDRKTFEIIDNSKSSTIMIVWRHNIF